MIKKKVPTKIDRDRKKMSTLLAVLLVVCCVSGCERATGQTGLMAEEVPAPPGVRCFAIMDGDRAVGGSCIEE
jgi:hypothetical protein